MQFIENHYYHIYNRTNNEEALFRCEENYRFFLKKYRFYLEDYLETIAYCLMPTHFHFLVRVIKADVPHLGINDKKNSKLNGNLNSKSVAHLENQNIISHKIKILLSSYTKAFNKRYERHGSLFQQNTKAKPVANDKYLINLVTYIHQNPIRSDLVDNAEDWYFSSFRDYVDERKGSLPSKELILGMIDKNDLKDLTNRKLIEL